MHWPICPGAGKRLAKGHRSLTGSSPLCHEQDTLFQLVLPDMDGGEQETPVNGRCLRHRGAGSLDLRDGFGDG